MPLFSLGTDLGIEASTDLKHRLADYLQHPDTLQLDGSAIERVHAASLQLLCALFRTRQNSGFDTHWSAVSPVLSEAARLLGLTALLDLTATPELSIHEPAPHQDLEIAV